MLQLSKMNLPIQPPAFSFNNLFTPQTLESPTVQTIIIALFFFVFLLAMGLGRRVLVKSSMQGVWAGFVMGVLLVGLLEGGFIYVLKQLNGNTIYIPNNLKAVLMNSQKNVTQVLGVQTERDIPTAQSVILDYKVLPKLDAELVNTSICTESNMGEDEGEIR